MLIAHNYRTTNRNSNNDTYRSIITQLGDSEYAQVAPNQDAVLWLKANIPHIRNFTFSNFIATPPPNSKLLLYREDRNLHFKALIDSRHGSISIPSPISSSLISVAGWHPAIRNNASYFLSTTSDDDHEDGPTIGEFLSSVYWAVVGIPKPKRQIKVRDYMRNGPKRDSFPLSFSNAILERVDV